MIAKKIGIWGYGVSGQSIVQFLHSKGYQLSLFDNRNLSTEIISYLYKNNVEYYQIDQFDLFMKNNDYVIPSPGIPISSHNQYQPKWLSEIDLFSMYYKRPLIAITGSVGKTSVTTLLGYILRQLNKKVQVGGNIGIGLCSLIKDQDYQDYAVLELSSFQLEYCSLLAPMLSIWTNFYPNHLDRHGTLQTYFQAKFNILSHQHENQKALIPFSLFNDENYRSFFYKTKARLYFFNQSKPHAKDIPADAVVYYFNQDKHIIKYQNNQEIIVRKHPLPVISYPDNWLIIAAALDILNLELPENIPLAESLEHRLEKIGTIKNVTIYNDSKATIMESTIAAIKQLNNKPIFLLLGGVSKGINRSHYMQQIQYNNVKHIFCFGKEAAQLQQYAKNYGLPSTAYDQLDSAIEDIFSKAQKDDQILFSPGGASFDQFIDYMHRGNYFKELIKKRMLNDPQK